MKNCLYYRDVRVRDSLQHSFLIHGLMTISGNLSIYARTVNRSWRPCDCPGFFIGINNNNDKQRESMTTKQKKVLEYDVQGKLVREWNDVEEIARHYNVTEAAIYSNLNGKTAFFKKGGTKRYFERKKYIP